MRAMKEEEREKRERKKREKEKFHTAEEALDEKRGELRRRGADVSFNANS